MAHPLQPGPPRIGLWLAMPEPLVVEAAAMARPDWVGLDLQHGAWDLGSAFRAIQLLDALSMPALIRVSEQELEAMPRVLDHGATGVVIAMASSVSLVEEAVERARYAPEGLRSYGGQRFGMRSQPSDVAEVRPGVFAMIEDRRGVAEVESIARVPGIAGLHIGPVDLGLGLGLGMDREAAPFTDALRRIVAAGHAAEVPVTLHAVRAQEADRWLDFGFDEFVLTSDIELLRAAFDEGVARVRNGNETTSPGAGPYGSKAES